MSNFLRREEVSAILYGLGGQMVTVNLIKKDGKPRTLNGQLVPSPPSHNEAPKLFTLALASSKKDNKQFRTGDLHRVTRIAGGGRVYQVTSHE